MSETKICPRCKIEYPLNEEYFPRHARDKSGFDTYCKKCKREMDREYYQRNKDKVRASVNAYKSANPEKVKAAQKAAREKNKEKYSSYKKEYYETNKEQMLAKQKEYYEANKDYISKRNKQWRDAHKEQYKQIHKEWYQANKEKIYKHCAERMASDPNWAMKQKIRWNISNSFRKGGYTKKSQAYKIIGLSYEDLIQYLLQTYKNNYGEEWDWKTPIHLDHIIPLATAQSEEDVIKLCHYTNLQFLKAEDNYKKGAKLNYEIKGEMYGNH